MSIKTICDAVDKFRAAVGVEKMTYTPAKGNPEIEADVKAVA